MTATSPSDPSSGRGAIEDRTPKGNPSRFRLRRFLVSWLQRVLFGLVCVGGMYVSARFGTAIRSSHHGISRLLWIGGFTPLIFGYFVSESRAWWKRPTFWAMTALFVTAHLLAFANLLIRHEAPGRWLSVGIAFAEFFVLVLLRNWLLPRSPRKRTGQVLHHPEQLP